RVASNRDNAIIKDIQHNCNNSDARDHGIYTICPVVLKLRNLYKWENDLEPWQEPEYGDLLDWIEAKVIYCKSGWPCSIAYFFIFDRFSIYHFWKIFF
ncbi:Sfum_1244 family protein, partial [Desulfocastanea catecholica]